MSAAREKITFKGPYFVGVSRNGLIASALIIAMNIINIRNITII